MNQDASRLTPSQRKENLETQAQMLRRARAMERLLSNSDFKEFREMLGERSAIYMADILNKDVRTDADIYEAERNKGAVSALDFVLQLPHATINEAKEIRSTMPDFPEDEDD